MRLTHGDVNRQPAHMDSTFRSPPVVPPRESPRRPLGKWWLPVVLLPILIVLYWYNPSRHDFYPRCGFHALTGLDCPGCGGLRATHALLRGDFAAAWRLNALFVAVAPLALLAFFGVIPGGLHEVWRRWWLTALVLASILFTVARNL